MKKEKTKSEKIQSYIIACVVNGILIWIVTKLPDWSGFLTGAYSAVLWMFIILFLGHMVANIIYIFFDPFWLRHSIQLGLNIFSFLAFYSTYIIFPFNFINSSDNLTRIILIIIMAGIGLGILVESIQLITKKDWAR